MRHFDCLMVIVLRAYLFLSCHDGAPTESEPDLLTPWPSALTECQYNHFFSSALHRLTYRVKQEFLHYMSIYVPCSTLPLSLNHPLRSLYF